MFDQLLFRSSMVQFQGFSNKKDHPGQVKRLEGFDNVELLARIRSRSIVAEKRLNDLGPGRGLDSKNLAVEYGLDPRA